MARQARSEATRQKILDAAVALFIEVGFAATGLGDIIERAELTKGALYYHFDSKESLASGVIAEASDAVFEATRGTIESASPALEKLIHLSFVVGGLVANDQGVRAGVQLARALHEFNTTAFGAYSAAQALLTTLAREACEEGDTRDELPPDAVAETLLATYLGTEVLSVAATGGGDLLRRLTRAWNILLPALTTAESTSYFQEFVSRETLRHPGGYTTSTT